MPKQGVVIELHDTKLILYMTLSALSTNLVDYNVAMQAFKKMKIATSNMTNRKQIGKDKSKP